MKRARKKKKHKPVRAYYAFLHERSYSHAAVVARDKVIAQATADGAQLVSDAVGRVDTLRNRISKNFLESGDSPDDFLILLDTDHAHDQFTIRRLVSWNVDVVGALAFRGSEPYDPQVYMSDPRKPGSVQQPGNWEPGLLQAHAIGNAAICIKRRVFQVLKDEYPWFRFEYTTGLDLFSGEDLYFSDLCHAYGIEINCDMSLVAPHLREWGIDEKPWLIDRGVQPAEDSPIPALSQRQVRQSDLMKKWDALKDKHDGETGIIIGNGPSLNDIPEDFLKRYPTFGSNRIYKKLTPTYYAFVNPLVAQQFGDEAFAALKGKTQRFFVNESWLWQREEYRMQPTVLPLKSLARKFFSTNPISGIYEGHTVTYVLMQLAFWMGFKRILLVGVDHKYETTGGPNEKVEATEPDPNHFDDDYFGPGVIWHNPDLVRSEEAYRMALKAYSAAGREIINCSTKTELGIFKLRDHREF